MEGAMRRSRTKRRLPEVQHDSVVPPMSVVPLWCDRCMFDVLVDELRTHSTEWLRREREQLVAQQRNLRTREMAVLRVLDERGQVDCSIGSQGESARTVRAKVDT